MKINKMIISFLMSTVLFSSIAPTINAEQAVKEPNYVIIDGVKSTKILTCQEIPMQIIVLVHPKL